ncbi:MAG: DUF4912 domain-containing protein [Kiritimatiellae bacterium]|nr:DUF4912 domain-containing protein [Kiritimatiellia bacterium]MDW8458864.1 DUF4912 domain-containing protein [Verrucomicrobiota bacterium]
MPDDVENPSPPDSTSDSPQTRETSLSAEDLRAISQEISSSYPPPRLGTELVLLEINPHRSHAYWNIDVADFRRAAEAAGDPNPPLLLRVHDITGVNFDGTNSNSFFDLQVQGLQGHWYVDLWQDGRTYIGEIGLRRPDGRLEILARSNPVSTPIASESPHYHTEAVNVAETNPENRLTDLLRPHPPAKEPIAGEPQAAGESTGDPNSPPLVIVPPPEPAAFQSPEIESAPPDLESADILPVGPQSGPDLPQRKEFPLPPGAESRPAVYLDVEPPPNESDFPEPAEYAFAQSEFDREVSPEPMKADSPTSETDESSSAVQPSPEPAEPRSFEERPDWPSAEELARFVVEAFAPGGALAAQSVETLMTRFAAVPSTGEEQHAAPPSDDAPAGAAVQREASEHGLPGSPQPAPPPANEKPALASEAPTPAASPRGGGNGQFSGPPASLPLENYIALFSAEHGSPQVALEVNVELHIFGRVRPGMQVSFYGQPVPLRPDGSFSLRKPLPHGAVVLPILATETPKNPPR